MDRNTIVRWILIAAIMLGGYWFFYGRKSTEQPQQLPQETYVDEPGFAPDIIDVQPGKPTPPAPPPGELCTLHGNRYEAVLSSRGRSRRTPPPTWSSTIGSTGSSTGSATPDASSPTRTTRFAWSRR